MIGRKQKKKFTALVKLNVMLSQEQKEELIKDLNKQAVKNKIVILPSCCELLEVVRDDKVEITVDYNYKDRLEKICFALNITLYGWQKDYILGKISYMKYGRGTGKTIAANIKTLLYDNLNKYYDFDCYKNPKWHTTKFIEMYSICLDNHIEFNNITINSIFEKINEDAKKIREWKLNQY